MPGGHRTASMATSGAVFGEVEVLTSNIITHSGNLSLWCRPDTPGETVQILAELVQSMPSLGSKQGAADRMHHALRH